MFCDQNAECDIRLYEMLKLTLGGNQGSSVVNSMCVVYDVLPIKGTQIQTQAKEFLVAAGCPLKLPDEWANFANCEDMPVFCERPHDLVIKRWTSVLVVTSQCLLQDVLVQHC